MALPQAEAAGRRGVLNPTLISTGEDSSLIGTSLGMTLESFKAMRFVDRQKYPKARVLCSGDAELQRSMALATMRPMPDEAAAGMIRCNVFRPDPVNLSWWAPIVPEIAGKPIKSTAFFFLPDDGGDYRLLFIQAVLPDSVLEQTHGQFVDTYGKPKKRTEPGLVTESLWTESWKTEHVWLLLDSRKSSYRHDFTVTYVNADLVNTAAVRGFDESRNILYYSAYTRFR
ncbi:MAG: hypothetical protein ABWY00_19090 [Dongiaceae bacterium]